MYLGRRSYRIALSCFSLHNILFICPGRRYGVLIKFVFSAKGKLYKIIRQIFTDCGRLHLLKMAAVNIYQYNNKFGLIQSERLKWYVAAYGMEPHFSRMFWQQDISKTIFWGCRTQTFKESENIFVLRTKIDLPSISYHTWEWKTCIKLIVIFKNFSNYAPDSVYQIFNFNVINKCITCHSRRLIHLKFWNFPLVLSDLCKHPFLFCKCLQGNFVILLFVTL